jgi:hypothetical protein
MANTLDTACNQAVVIAMRGRGDKGNIKQELEYGGDITNTITSVQKDT